MQHHLIWRAAVALPLSVLVAWLAVGAEPAVEAPYPATGWSAASLDSPYPAPRVDPSAPPQEPAPTF